MKSLRISPGACGILGAISLDGGSFAGADILRSISTINYRGSDLGAGFAYFDRSPDLYVEAFASDMKVVENVAGILSGEFDIKSSNTIQLNDKFGDKLLWTAKIETDASPLNLEAITERANSLYPLEGAEHFRFVSAGFGLHVRKGIGYPSDIYNQYSDISRTNSHLWIAHTRQPTNSPGQLPVFSHPFSSFNIAVVHNGDISSFGANVQALVNHGMSDFVGTDSEMIAKLLAILIHKYNLSLEEAASVLCGKMQAENVFRGFALDGPFSVAAAIRIGNKDYLVAMVDRSKLRPALIGKSDNRIIVASERNQIKALGGEFNIHQLRGGQYMIASSDGEVYYG